MDQFRDKFREEEALEILDSLEKILLMLENDNSNQNNISSVFRDLHTMKGTSSMFGLTKVSTFVHELESLLEGLRTTPPTAYLTKNIINEIFKCLDYVKYILAEDENIEDFDKNKAQKLNSLEKIMYPHGMIDIKKHNTIIKDESPNEDIETIYRIFFKPNKDIFLTGNKPIIIINELLEMGDSQVYIDIQNVPDLENLNPQEIFIEWTIVLSTKASFNKIKDVFLFVEDGATISINAISNGFTKSEKTPLLGEILVNKNIISVQDLEEALKLDMQLGDALISKFNVNKDDIDSAFEEQSFVKKKNQDTIKQSNVKSIRVDSIKLDFLVDLVGELVTVQARLNQKANDEHIYSITSILEELEFITNQLRDSTMGIRMIPIDSTFSKFKRLVRDLSSEFGKEVDYQTEGGETELDKNIVEKLDEPLVHLIRNSLDHAIEMPSVRVQKGKDPQGIIKITAKQTGAAVVISIEDDGAGINKEKVYQKAIEKGIIKSDHTLTEQEILHLIFAPGFSTAEKITSISGRGVGMDVVKKQIESMRGSIQILSTKDLGTKISLTFPLTLAIIDGLLVRIGEEFFILPLSNVERCLELTPEMKKANDNNRMINFEGKTISYTRIRDFFKIDAPLSEEEQIIVIHSYKNTFGIVVDEVIGKHDTVIKSLGKIYKSTEGVTGATILGSGRIALILDIELMEKLSSTVTTKFNS